MSIQTKPSPKLGYFSVLPTALGGIILLACILRVARLDFQPLWWDEGYSVFFATRDLPTLLARTAADIHPPLYYVLLQFWISVFGSSEIALRLLSVLIGVAVIPLMYLLAKRLFSGPAALVAALLLAVSPFHIYYSQEIRMYGLLTLFGMASVYALIRLVELPPGERRTVGYVVAYVLFTTSALYTEYYAALLVAFEIVAVLVWVWRQTPRVDRKKRILHWTSAWFAIAVLYLPWIIYSSVQLYSYVSFKVVQDADASLDPVSFLAQYLAAFSVGHLTALPWLAWSGLVTTALALLGAVTGLKKHEGTAGVRDPLPAVIAILYVAIPLILAYLINLIYPFNPVHVERLLLFAAPGFYLLAALGISAIWQNRIAFGSITLIAILLISAASLTDFYSTPRYPEDDYRPLIAQVQSLAQPGDAVLAVYPWQIGYLKTYYRGAPIEIVETPSNAWVNKPVQMQADVDSIQSQHRRVWLFAFQPLGRILEDALDEYLRPRDYTVLDTWYGTTRLELFSAASDPPAAGHPLAISSSDPPISYGVSSGDATSGQDIIRLWFDWGKMAVEGKKISLRMYDAAGNIWAQDDRDIEHGRQRIGIPIPVGVPPGGYALSLIVYSAGDASDSIKPIELAPVHVHSPALPNVSALPVATHVDFGNGVVLAGLDLPANTLRPGEPSAITLFWLANHPLITNYGVVLQMQDAFGNIFGQVRAPIARGIYPSSQWKPDEVVRDPQALTLRPDTPDGTYNLVASLVGAGPESVMASRPIGTVTVRGRPHYYGSPSPSFKTGFRLGGTARLVGYNLSKNTQGIGLVLYWQCLDATPTSYTVFVHVLDKNGTIIGQRDQIPGAGAFPTTSWVKGEYLVDEYEIAAPAVPDRQIEIGMYDLASGARLPVFDEHDQSQGERILLSIP